MSSAIELPVPLEQREAEISEALKKELNLLKRSYIQFNSVWIPAPNSFAEERLMRMWLSVVLENLTPDSYWETGLERVYSQYLMAVVTRFYKKGFNSRAIASQIPKGSKRLIDQDVELWLAAWDVIKHINMSFDKALLMLGGIIQEHQILMMIFIDGTEELSGATSLLRHFQKQNRALQTFKNPFQDSAKYPYTHRLLEEAIAKANASDHFRKYFYNRFVQARMSFITYWKGTSPRICEPGKGEEKRGRPKRKKR